MQSHHTQTPFTGRRRAASKVRLALAFAAALAATAVGAAPAAAAASAEQSALAAERPYSASSPWNTPIPANPALDPNSAAIIAAFSASRTLTSDPTQYTYPVYEVPSGTSLLPVKVANLFSNVTSETELKRSTGTTVNVPIPADAQAAAGTDAQVIIVNWATGDEWGFWQLRKDSSGNFVATNGYHYNVDWSAVPPRDASGNPFGSRGAGVPYFTGLVRPWEIQQGRIEHALAIAYDYPSPDWVYPASKSDGKNTAIDGVPEGTRFQLDPSFDVSTLSNPIARMVARALQEYGAYVIDNSGSTKVMFEYEGTAGWSGQVTRSTVSQIPLSRFRVLLPEGAAPPAPPALAADFSGTPTAGSAPLSVSFADRSIGLPTSWRWDFGDGATSTERNPSHVYAANGTYAVTLTVGDASGGSTTTTRAGYVSVSDAPPPPPPPAPEEEDTTAPTVSLTQPSGSATLRGTATLDADASDDVGVTRVDYFLGAAAVAYDASCCAWDESWDSRTVADGTYTLVAKARDAAGNVGTSRPVEVLVDNVADGPACTIVGTAGSDVLRGTSGKDVICSLDGNDTVRAASGDDVVYGGAGNDSLYGEGGNDVLLGGPGADKLSGGSGQDRLYAEDASGSWSGRAVVGASLALRSGAEVLHGESGDDLLVGSRLGDRLFGGPGRDRLRAGDGDDFLTGGRSRDELLGGAGRDTFFAREGRRDRLDGGAGRDRGEVDRRLDRRRSLERLV